MYALGPGAGPSASVHGPLSRDTLPKLRFVLADTTKGNRPSLSHAASPERAEPLYEEFCAALEAAGVRVSRGVFAARMDVELVNEGPVAIVLG